SSADIDVRWLEGVSRVGLTAGASAPEVLVEQVSQRLAEFGFTHQRDLDLIREGGRFTLPPELANLAPAPHPQEPLIGYSRRGTPRRTGRTHPVEFFRSGHGNARAAAGNSRQGVCLGGQDRPSAEEDCLDWRAFKRRRFFPGQ